MEPVPSNWIGLTPGERAVYTYKASWTRTSSLAFETKQYDAGEHADKLNVYDGSRIATRFEIEHPDRTRLDNVMVPLYYQSTRYINFGDETAPRDFTLHIWEDEADLPGREIFSKSIVDPRPIAWLETTHFLKVDLSSDEVAPLSQFVHVGASNAGSDGNTILIAMTSHEADVSSHFSIGSWTDLWDVLSDYTYIAPFRITVAVGPDAVHVAERLPNLPAEVSLQPNFPNPFDGETTISYGLPRPADVRLTVVDVLGRQIKVLASGNQPAGTHNVTFDATALSSGVYFYRLRASDYIETRWMLLVR